MNEVGGKHETSAPPVSWDSMSVPQGPPIPLTHENIQQVMVPVPIKMQPPLNMNPMMDHGAPIQQGPMASHVSIPHVVYNCFCSTRSTLLVFIYLLILNDT